MESFDKLDPISYTKVYTSLLNLYVLVPGNRSTGHIKVYWLNAFS